MVSSKINPKIQYIERKTIDPEDLGFQSTLYVIDVYDVPILIVLGKQKYTHSNKDVVYYPIYIVSGNKIKSQIGVYESKMSDTIRLVDEDGDIDIDKMDEPLLYSFVNKKYILKSNSNPNELLDATLKEHVEDNDNEKEQKEKTTDEDEDEDDDEIDIMKLKVSPKKLSEEKQKADKIIDDGIFITDDQFRQPAMLTEELESDADKVKMDYKESSTNQWIEKFMKNNNYDIIDNEGSGDCFFAVIRDAFESIGKKTTVTKLRNLLSAHVTDEVFQENYKLFLDFESQKQEISQSLKDLKDANTVYEKRMSTITDKSESEKIINETKKIKDEHEKKRKELKDVTKLQEQYVGYMKNIDTIDKYREYIKTASFWADTWAISTLEYLLKIKVIILSEEAYKGKSLDNVLNCGEVNKEMIKNDHVKKMTFEPTHYIITSYSGDHYKLITYKRKHIFAFNEIPYDIKILVINKCLEKNSGIYYLIQDFRNFKSKLGLDPDEGNPDLDEDDSDDDIHSHLYSKSAVFVFHSKALDSAKPGKGANESIEKSRQNEFAVLSNVENWRRKLDDAWILSPFTIDKHRWASVEHYLQASKFKKGFPDFYEQFSLDVPSELSKDAEMAKMVGDISKTKFKSLRPAKVKIDVDYNLGRSDIERETALTAKFTQNEDMKQLLLLTKNAYLKQYIRRKPAKGDMLLMKIRNEIKKV